MGQCFHGNHLSHNILSNFFTESRTCPSVFLGVLCVNAKRMVQWIHSLSWILFLKIMRFFRHILHFVQSTHCKLWAQIYEIILHHGVSVLRAWKINFNFGNSKIKVENYKVDVKNFNVRKINLLRMGIKYKQINIIFVASTGLSS